MVEKGQINVKGIPAEAMQKLAQIKEKFGTTFSEYARLALLEKLSQDNRMEPLPAEGESAQSFDRKQS